MSFTRAALILAIASTAATADPSHDWVRGMTRSSTTIYAATPSKVRAFDANLKVTAEAPMPTGVEAYGVALSPDGHDLAVARTDGIWVVDAKTLKERRMVHPAGKIEKLPDATMETEDPFGDVRGVGYATDGKLVSISERGALCFEAAKSCYDAMPSHTGVIEAGRPASFAVVGADAVFAWRASKLIVIHPGAQPQRLGKEHELPDNGTELLAAATNGWIAIDYESNNFDLIRPGKRIRVWAEVAALAFSPNGRYLVASTRKAIVRYDLRCLDKSPPNATKVTTTNEPIASSLLVSDTGEVIGGDLAGNVTKLAGADSSPPPTCR
ncbi:MAG: hypothetical protein QM831_41025 [Kofleriaceae bacterium]